LKFVEVKFLLRCSLLIVFVDAFSVLRACRSLCCNKSVKVVDKKKLLEVLLPVFKLSDTAKLLPFREVWELELYNSTLKGKFLTK